MARKIAKEIIIGLEEIKLWKLGRKKLVVTKRKKKPRTRRASNR